MHEDCFVRCCAARALGRLDPRDAIDPLVRGLQDLDPAVRREAARALGQFGTKAAEVAPALTGLLEDPEATVREEAEQALALIRS
jgi:HEAT repeat protein